MNTRRRYRFPAALLQPIHQPICHLQVVTRTLYDKYACHVKRPCHNIFHDVIQAGREVRRSTHRRCTRSAGASDLWKKNVEEYSGERTCGAGEAARGPPSTFCTDSGVGNYRHSWPTSETSSSDCSLHPWSLRISRQIRRPRRQHLWISLDLLH